MGRASFEKEAGAQEAELKQQLDKEVKRYNFLQEDLNALLEDRDSLAEELGQREQELLAAEAQAADKSAKVLDLVAEQKELTAKLEACRDDLSDMQQNAQASSASLDCADSDKLRLQIKELEEERFQVESRHGSELGAIMQRLAAAMGERNHLEASVTRHVSERDEERKAEAAERESQMKTYAELETSLQEALSASENECRQVKKRVLELEEELLTRKKGEGGLPPGVWWQEKHRRDDGRVYYVDPRTGAEHLFLPSVDRSATKARDNKTTTNAPNLDKVTRPLLSEALRAESKDDDDGPHNSRRRRQQTVNGFVDRANGPPLESKSDAQLERSSVSALSASSGLRAEESRGSSDRRDSETGAARGKMSPPCILCRLLALRTRSSSIYS